MIIYQLLDKNEVQRFLPLLFSILHGSMSVIAPTGNAYDEDYSLWSGAVATAMQKENRQIVLIFSDDILIGYLQYYTNETTFMIEEAQIRPAFQGRGIIHIALHVRFEYHGPLIFFGFLRLILHTFLLPVQYK